MCGQGDYWQCSRSMSAPTHAITAEGVKLGPSPHMAEIRRLQAGQGSSVWAAGFQTLAQTRFDKTLLASLLTIGIASITQLQDVWFGCVEQAASRASASSSESPVLLPGPQDDKT